MSKELFFIGAPAEFKEGVLVYPPTLREVITDDRFGVYCQILTYSQEEIEDIYTKEKKDLADLLNPMEFLLNNCYNSKEYAAVCKMAFQFFLHTPVEFIYEKKMIMIGSFQDILDKQIEIEDLVFITEEEFFDFQNLIRMAINQKQIERPKEDEDPRVKAIKARARYRDKLKAKQNARKGITLFTTMASICCMGAGMNPLNIGEISYVAMDAILNQYQSKERYQIDIDSLLAGADSKKVKPQYWIRNLD